MMNKMMKVLDRIMLTLGILSFVWFLLYALLLWDK